MKICIKCKILKKLSEFHLNMLNRDGHKNVCKSCCRRINKKYKAEYRLLPQNKLRERKYSAHYIKINKDKESNRQHRYYVDNIEYVKNRNKQWFRNHPAKRREYVRKRRAFKIGLMFTDKHERCVYDAFNNACVVCGSIKNLIIDHFKPLIKGNPLTFNNAVVLCPVCNSSKGIKDPTQFFTHSQLDHIYDRMAFAQSLYGANMN